MGPGPLPTLKISATLEPITSDQATNGQRLLLIPGRASQLPIPMTSEPKRNPKNQRGYPQNGDPQKRGPNAFRPDFALFAGDFARRLRRSVLFERGAAAR